MSERLSLTQIALLGAYAAGMAGGQILFKAAALRLPAEVPFAERVVGLLQNGMFIAALALYLVLSVLWVWVLSFTPLSRAYPFVALAFVITPILGGLVFGEPISMRLALGIATIAFGLFLVVG
jgi:drug/metabolite transporter (DMT)-like permease